MLDRRTQPRARFLFFCHPERKCQSGSDRGTSRIQLWHTRYLGLTIRTREVPHSESIRSSGCQNENQARNRSPTSDRSSFSSFTLASTFPRLNSLIGTFCTTSGLPSFTLTGNEQIKRFSTPYSQV